MGTLKHSGGLQFPVIEEDARIPSFSFSFSFFLAMLASLRDLSFLNQGSNPCSLHWERRVLTTGRPGKSLLSLNLKENVTPEGRSSGVTHDTYMFS